MKESNATDQIVERLIAWGCDIPGALPRFLNNRDFYCRLLAEVPEEGSFAKLGTCLAAGDAKAAFDEAHALKGVLGNMGLTPMYGEVCAIVEPLRGGTLAGTREHYDRLMEYKARLISILQPEDESGHL